MLCQIALVAKTRHVSLAEAAEVAAALQKQVARDAGPIWGLQASISAFAELKDYHRLLAGSGHGRHPRP